MIAMNLSVTEEHVKIDIENSVNSMIAGSISKWCQFSYSASKNFNKHALKEQTKLYLSDIEKLKEDIKMLKKNVSEKECQLDVFKKLIINLRIPKCLQNKIIRTWN